VGCGGGQNRTAEKRTTATEAVAAAQTGIQMGAQAAVNPAALAQPLPGIGATSADSLPPEVAPAVEETAAVPGSVIEVTAEGSADVVGVVLGDATGRKYPLALDSASNLWRVFYRVPLKVREERLGLSLTATNGAGRWRRAWVFVPVQTVAQTVEPKSEAADSTAK
jgi:hypothetical protein